MFIDDVNQAMVVGEVADEPKVTINADRARINLRVMTRKQDRKSKDLYTTFHNVVVWGAMAHGIKGIVTKGSRIFASGEIRVRGYDGPNGKQYITELNANNVGVLKPTEQPTRYPEPAPYQQRQAPAQQAYQQHQPQSPWQAPATVAQVPPQQAPWAPDPEAEREQGYPEEWDK